MQKSSVKKSFTRVTSALAGAIAIGSMFSQAALADSLTIGYQGMMNPWKQMIATQQLEEKTGQEIEWRRFDSGAKVITAMASGDIDIATAGSSPIAAAISRGVDIELVWILENINEAEALVVSNASGIVAPQDLKGKTLGVPFVSTTHFHTLFALEQFGLSEKDVKVINMQPNAIAAAWQRGDVDAAFIWDPVLGRIKTDGKVLISSGELSRWGKATFDGLVVNKEYGKAHPEVVGQLIKLMAAADAEYRDGKATFSADSEMAKNIAKLTGGDVNQVPEVLSLYQFPTLDEQLGCAWLGCGAEGGAAKALKFTSEFLKQQGKVPALKEDYSLYVNPSYAEMAKTL